jgi:PAT family beta-lactamase induction signal transducer AmpG
MAAKRTFREALLSYAQPRVATMLVLGAACGLPLLTIANTLGLWLTDSNVTMTSIGLFAYTLLPYSLKFLWAPLLDQVKLPVLHRLLGKRRSWMLVAQLGVLIAFTGLYFSDPASDLMQVALFAFLLGFAGASQDISVDAWRIEVAPKEEQGAMVAAYQLGYRLCVLATGVAALYIAQFVSWHAGILFLGSLMLLGIGATLIAERVEERDASEEAKKLEKMIPLRGKVGGGIAWFYGAVIGPFVDFFRRHKWDGLLVLLMVGTYRLPDFIMGTMAGPMYRQSFSLVEIANVSKAIGVWVTIGGAILGGLFVARFGVMKALFVGIIGVILGNLSYAWLASQGHDLTAFAIAIGIENTASGFAGTALIAYLSSLTSTAFTATQYALFSSFYALPGKIFGPLSGTMVDWFSANRLGVQNWLPGLGDLPDKVVGFVPFFICTALIGIPALILLILVYWREGEGMVPTPKPKAVKA